MSPHVTGKTTASDEEHDKLIQPFLLQFRFKFFFLVRPAVEYSKKSTNLSSFGRNRRQVALVQLVLVLRRVQGTLILQMRIYASMLDA